MTTYKFKSEDKEPPEEQIGRHKDFASLKATYDSATKRSKTPLYKNKKVFLALIIVVLLAILMAEFLDEQKKNNKAPNQRQAPVMGDSVKTP
jgi:hypothetical protein